MNHTAPDRQRRLAGRALLRGALTRARCPSGAAVVEFAIVLPILLLIVLGTAQFALATNAYNNETQLANSGARWAAVNVNPGSGSLQSYIKSQGDTAQIQSSSTVCISFPTNPATGTSAKVGDPVQVTVSLDFNWLPYITNMVPGSGTKVKITGSAVMRLEQPPTTYGAGCA